VSTAVLGEYFSLTLETKKQQKAEELASLVQLDIEREIEGLRKSARLLSIKTEVVDAVAQEDTTDLQKQILPLRGAIEADYISIVGRQAQTLLDTRKASLQELTIDDSVVTDILLSGAEVSLAVKSAPAGPPILIGGTPLKNEQGVVGGTKIGIALDDELLSTFDQTIEGHLIALSVPTADELESLLDQSGSQTDKDAVTSNSYKVEVIAASDEIHPDWLDVLLGDFSEDYDHNHIGVHSHHSFIGQHINIAALEDSGVELMLLVSKEPLNQAKRTLWLFLLAIAGAGCGVTSILSMWIGKRLARPILSLTDVAQQVVQEKDFSLRAGLGSDDELGLLANAFDQLVQRAGDYTQALEQSAHTLESRVEERTQALSTALAELQDTQSQLIQTEKMSSLGQMVAGIAHEINNPISFIQGNLSPLQDYIGDLMELVETYQAEYPQPTEAILEKEDEIDLEFLLEDSKKILGSLRMGTERVRDIVVSLRNYSRLDEAAIKDVDLHEGINSTLLILNHRIKHGVEVIKDYGNLPLVRCSPSQLNQVFTNIIANALDAMFDAGSQPMRLTVTTRSLPDGQIQIRFGDTGPGMPPEIKAKIFDPFFTTKTVGKGTGMGMGICFKIIEQHQGNIDVITAVGKGAEFVLTLPVDRSATPPQPPALTLV